jgi:hypothetical protein
MDNVMADPPEQQRMTWLTFGKIFCALQLAGVLLAILGIVHSFIAVMIGMIFLFPGALIVSAQINAGAAAVMVAIMLAINVAFWIAILRPHMR